MRFIGHWIVAATMMATAAASFAAPRDGLAVRVTSAAPVVRGNVDVTVTVSVTNTTAQAIELLRWELPSNRPEGATFRILRDGQPVAYTGRIVKRAAPTREDYVRIEAGATLTYEIELTAFYDLSRNGTYSIEYVGHGSPDAGTARTEPTYLWLESRTAMTAAPALQAGGSPDATISFTGNCSAARQTQLIDAVTAATVYSDAAVRYFASTRGPTARYTKWFGAANRDRWNTVKSNYTKIQDAFVNKAITLDCSCTDSSYAYVFSNQPYKIYLCNAFWAAPLTGTDSRAGTLVHEMSHFTVVAGTGDYAYGQSAAAALAISNPANAVRNADSHEYFAENTPTLP